ncbi:hypothetical protein PHMEG_0005307 [Phytophthora megakarya]|uniref:Uncharacterized protein n=1 Tax=Phytophthora megakarya TaxID=4795 RepID=A0A225WRT3_9STRA|nr:hypothetical protein PHMEG_0005307 [Phytophthora megakarya]
MSKTLKGQGRKEIFPGVSDLLTFMKDIIRREEAVCNDIIQYIWKIHLQSLEAILRQELPFWTSC